MTEEKTYTEAEAQRHFAAKFNGDVWGLLEKADRSKADDEVMVHAAHASCCHWLAAGTGVHHQRGEWMIARVYAELGLAEAALRHARRCQELTEEHADLMEDFDRAYALEGLARAHAVAGDHDRAREYLELAQKAGEAIADEESKKFFSGDLEGGNWYGIG
jgi:tetratricopeptide (TPR) repeat protein